MRKKYTIKMKTLFTILFSTLLIFSFSQNIRSSISYSEAPFFHGVASGDPTTNKVIIWTRVTPYSGTTTAVNVYWQIATDTAFQNIVNFGKVTTTDSRDFTVKVDVCGLQPNTYYYYVFKAFGNNSVIGRTKTTPIGNNAEVRYGIVHGTNYEHGFFNGYESLANRNDLDAILHLGDYYYEYKTGGFSSSVMTDTWGRTNLPTHETINLSDYRIRHSHYKLDNQLQLAHQMHPFITIWDDHETANDSYKNGAQNHDPATEGPWIDRKVSSAQAYDEWMPIRTDSIGNSKVWRNIKYGNLLNLILLDTRMWERDKQNMALSNDPSHLIMANDEFNWLKEQLLDTTTTWKLIGNQVMFAPLEIFGVAVNADQWDGYNAQRQQLIQFIDTNNIQNVVFLTGDIHSAWYSEIENSSGTAVATEYVGTSVTSPGLDVIETALGQLPQWLLNSLGGSIPAVLKFLNPHMKYINIEDHGYMIFTTNTNKVQADLVFNEREDTIYTDDYNTSWFNNINSNLLQQAPSYIVPNSGPIKPPLAPRQNIPFAIIEDTIFVSMDENTILNNCIVDVASVCPNISTSIFQNASFGNAIITDFCYQFQAITNYYGNQSFEVEICSNSLPIVCDTVVVQVTINGINDIEEFDYSFYNDSILTDCITFNDLTTTIDSISTIGGLSGIFSIDANNCFTFEADTNFCGQDNITVVACDNNGICDTVILNFIIDGKLSTQIVNLYGEDNQLLNNCLMYDEIVGNILSTDLIYTTTNGSALIYNDTCLSYKSNLLFDGIDTLVTVACDDFVPEKCDTIIYYMHITHPIDTTTEPNDTIAIKELENNEFSILGVFPNPFDVEIIIQYYQYTPTNLSLKMYDVQGNIIFNKKINDNSLGLNYAKLKTKQLAQGNYLLEISNERFSYIKKLVK